MSSEEDPCKDFCMYGMDSTVWPLTILIAAKAFEHEKGHAFDSDIWWSRYRDFIRHSGMMIKSEVEYTYGLSWGMTVMPSRT